MPIARCPGGMRPGQLNLLVLRRVIMGDIAVTAVDLALRGYVSVEESADGWAIRPAPVPLSGPRRQSLLGYERLPLDALVRASESRRSVDRSAATVS